MRQDRAAPYNGDMSETNALAHLVNTPPTRWSVGGLFLEALAARDFTRMSDCLEDTATMRALLPPGLAQCDSATQIVDSLRSWFGGAEEFEVLDGTVGEVGGRLHLAWRLRLRPTPWGDNAWHIIEQQAYLQATERIGAIDLLCSGFQPEEQA
jgi:hypothetical protein